MDYRILGALVVASEAGVAKLAGRGERILTAALILRPNEAVSMASLEAALWDFAPAKPEHSVQVLVAKVRTALDAIGGQGLIFTESPGYRLEASRSEIDGYVYERQVGIARKAMAEGELDVAEAVLAEADVLWRGPPLAEFAMRPFVEVETRRLREIRTQATVLRLAIDVAQGRHHASVADLVALAEQHPYREDLLGLTMTALYRSGRQFEALTVYSEYEKRLHAAAGVGPGKALRRIEQQIRDQSADLDLDTDA